ncbi:MAG: DNA recombination protein RmuC [Mycobacteriales bacterium]
MTTGLIALLTLLAGAAVGVSVARAGSARAVAERDAARAEVERLRRERESVEGRARAAEADGASLRATVEHQRRSADQRAAELQRTIDTLKDTFGELSATALARNNEQFVALAQQHLKTATTEASGDLAQRQQAITALVDPLRLTLGKVEDQLRTVEKERASAYSDLLAQVGTMRQSSDSLRVETAQLVTALRAPQVRGRWGEMQLRRVVESAGMVEHCDFDEQVTVGTADGSLRPDLVVHLAGGKQVIVDAKVAFSGYLEAMEARDETTRASRLRAHARHLRTHVDQLGAKAYWQHFAPTPEFVIAFVPADAFLNAALEEDPSILEHAFSQNVVIATPTTLIAMLKTVAYTWRQEALAANAAQIHQLGRELHARLATMGGHVAKLGGQLGKAVASYNQTVSSLEGRVLVTARRLTELKVTDTELTTPAQITEVPRQVQAQELVASASDTLVALRNSTRRQPPPEQAPLGAQRPASGD